MPVGIGSHHPFPAMTDTTEAYVTLVMQVIDQMRQTDHPACSTKAGLMEEIWERMACDGLSQNYTTRKVFPPAGCSTSTIEFCQKLWMQTSNIFFSETEDQLGLWRTLNLLLINLLYHLFLQDLNSLKEPQVSVPEEMWRGVDKEVGLFPTLVKKITLAFFADHQVPPFKRLLEIICGGSLKNACTFCHKQIVVVSIVTHMEGNKPAVCKTSITNGIYCLMYDSLKS